MKLSETTVSKSRGRIDRNDNRQVARLVGYFEYGNALDNFDRLLKLLSEDELDIVDEMVAEHDQYTISTNRSRHLQRAPSSLANPEQQSQVEFTARGLKAVMALARVELAAMLAAFTDVPRPFENVNPSQFEWPVYKTMLLDGARSHYWGLVGDPDLRRVARMSAQNTQVLSYSRRLVLARSMLRAATKANIAKYTPVQMRELSSWSDGLDALQTGFYTKIQLFLAEMHAGTTRNQSEQKYNLMQSCDALLRAERREIREGTAKFTRF